MDTMHNPFEDPETGFRERYQKLLPLLAPPQARLVLGADANDLIAHGFPDGIDIIARAAGVDHNTVNQGRTELDTHNTPTK
ncbi:MAG: hypothetical protein QM619_00745 [Micropruina sp.]|uniref:hypothetical protein n=1 Tax=Micropruina sp. TaxID=2737536 RepID=UPI0039E6BBC6